MKKITYLILLLSLIVYISTQDWDVCEYMEDATKKKCTEYTLNEQEKTE